MSLSFSWKAFLNSLGDLGDLMMLHFVVFYFSIVLTGHIPSLESVLLHVKKLGRRCKFELSWSFGASSSEFVWRIHLNLQQLVCSSVDHSSPPTSVCSRTNEWYTSAPGHAWWYCSGFGGFGALGHGSYEKVVTPKLVDGRAVGMENIVHIAAGGAHTAAVSAAGTFQQDMNGITLGITCLRDKLVLKL